MKTLVNKRNPAIRIIAPEIVLSANKEQYWIAGIPQTARTYLAKEWTLVEEEPEKKEQTEVDLDKLVNEEFASHSRTIEYGLEVTYNRAELYQLIKRMALLFNARKEE